MAGTEYFGETAAEPRDHIPVNITQSHTFAALIRLSTTTHNLLTFNISKISPNNSEKLSLLPDLYHYMRNFCNLIGLEQWKITNKCENYKPFAGSSINK